MAVSGSWNQYESTPMSALRADVLADGAHHLDVIGHVASETHLDPGEPERHALVEVVGVPVGRLVEHGRSGAVQRDGVRARAEQLVDGRTEVLAEDVPERDLDRADGLARRPFRAEVAVEHDPEIGHPVTDRQRILADEVAGADVVDDGAEHRGIGVAPVRRRLTPSDGAVVGLDAHQREAALHRRIALAIAGEPGTDVDDLHRVVTTTSIRSLPAPSVAGCTSTPSSPDESIDAVLAAPGAVIAETDRVVTRRSLRVITADPHTT